MPKVERHDTDALNGVLEVYLPKEEYIKDVQKEINKYSRNAQMKGFRKGKTPPSVISGLYGQSMLMQTVNEKVVQTLNEYLEENRLSIIGRPLASEEQESHQINLTHPEDLTFRFDVGYNPTFTLKALDKTDSYERFVVEPTGEEIDEQLASLRKKYGVQGETEEGVEEGDVLKLDSKEVDGETVAQIPISMRDINDDVKEYLLGKKKGDVIRFDVFNLEKGSDEKFVKRHLLGVDEDAYINREFEAKIETVTRMLPAELDEVFYKKIFGPETTVDTEEAAREEIRKIYIQSYAGASNALLNKSIQERLMAENDFQLPDQFIKRWLKSSESGRYNDEMIEREYPYFKESMRWTIIRNKIAEETGFIVGDQDVKEAYRAQLFDATGGSFPLGDDFIDSLYDRVKNDEKQYSELYEEAASRKTFQAARSRVTVQDQPVSTETLREMMERARKEAESSRGVKSEENFEQMADEEAEEIYAAE